MSKAWDADWASSLSADRERVVWPPRIGAKVHYNSGWPLTSWTGEVRAVIDDEVVVFLSSLPGYAAYAGRNSYKLETKIGVGVFSRAGVLRYGPLPRPLMSPLPGDER